MSCNLTPYQRFIKKFKSVNGCWIWEGYLSNGYGRFSIDGESYLAHRASFAIYIGGLTDKDLVCHKCDNPSCVNPMHLFKGTHKDNTQDGIRKGRINPFNHQNKAVHPSTTFYRKGCRCDGCKLALKVDNKYRYDNAKLKKA